MRLFISLLLTLLCTKITSLMNFERIIWLYWQTDITQAPLVTRISYEKLVIAAQKANWTVNLVTGQNAKNYIPDYERFQEVVKRGYRNSVQQKSDILRITLVEANGGVWIDFACVLFQDLSWLSDQTKFQSLIINRIGTNKQDPDMLMLGQGYHQSPLSYYNQEGALVNDQYFGMAIHFIAAKKKSPIMTAWKQKMYTVTTLSYQQFLPQIHANRLYFHNIDRDTMYYSGNMALQSVLQQKQMEFDNNLTLHSKRVNVYQHFKIWMVHGQVGPILMTRKHLMNGRDLFLDTIEEIEQRAGKVRFYLKMAKFLREQVQQKQKPTQDYFTKNNITIEQILQRGPTFHQCSLFFIVQNSILHNFYQNSKYSHQIKTPIITVPQRQQLKSHCWYKSPSIYLSSHSYRSQGQMTRPERELLSGKVEGFFGWLIYAWVTNSLVFWAWFEWFRVLGYLVAVYWAGKYLLFRYQVSEIGEMGSDEEESVNEAIDEGKKDTCSESRTRFMLGKPSVREVLLIAILILVTSASLQFYEEFQDMGKYPQYECTLLVILTVFLLRGLIKKLTQSTIAKPTFFNLQKIMKNTRYLIFLPLAFCVFLHFDIVYSFAFYHAIVIAGGGLMLYGLLEELSERQLINRYFDLVKKILKLSRWIVIVIFLAFYLLPNLRYLRRDHHYIKENHSQIALTMFGYTFILTIAGILVSLYKRLKRSTSEADKNEMLHMIFSTVTVLILTLRSHLAYDTIISSPSSYNVMGNFQIILIVYTLHNVSIRQRLSSQSTSTQLFVMSNIFPAFYMVFGMWFLKFFDIIPLRWLWFTIIAVYVMLVIVQDQWTNEQEFNKIENASSEMFHGVELSPKGSKE